MVFDNVKWLFFDMGSTLIDGTESYKGWFQNASDAIGGKLSPAEIERRYLDGIERYEPTITEYLKPFGYAHDTTSHLYPQAKPLLERLSGMYRLGVIANQSPGADERLKNHGLLKYFEFVLGSADVGFSKPDPRIFLLALEKAGCEPHEAVMIGDRPDYDVYPAKQLGLRTIRIR